MRNFHFHLEDERFEAPQELVVEASGEARARQIAERMLAQSIHHKGVDVWEDGRRLFGLGSYAARSWGEQGRRA